MVAAETGGPPRRRGGGNERLTREAGPSPSAGRRRHLLTSALTLEAVADPRSTAVLPSPKVSVPLPVDRAVQRPRLWSAALDHGPHDLHVLLACAPAGFGKSSMLTEFAEFAEHQRAAGLPFGWVTCDRDDDAATFWEAVIVAARAAEPRQRGSRHSSFEVPAGAAGRDEAEVTTFLRRLADLGIAVIETRRLPD